MRTAARIAVLLACSMYALRFGFCSKQVSDAEATSDGFKMRRNVYLLDDSNFDRFLQKHPIALVDFHTPTCKVCQSLLAALEATATALLTSEQKPDTPRMVVAIVDAARAPAAQARFDIDRYPTAKFFVAGKTMHYDGDRDKIGMLDWLREHSAADYTAPVSRVVALTAGNFSAFVRAQPLFLAQFYAPWCGHCRRLAPEYERAARLLAAETPPVPLVKIDATQESDLAKEYGLDGYPMLKVFRRQKPYEYRGSRDTQSLVDYMRQMARPAAVRITDTRQAETVQSQVDVTVIGVANTAGSTLAANFQEAAEGMRHEVVTWAYASHPSVMKQLYTPTKDQVFVILPPRFQSEFESELRVMEADSPSAETIVDFVRANAVPLVGQRTQRNQLQRYVHRPLVVVYLSIDWRQNEKEVQHWRAIVLRVAQEYRPDYRFAISDENEYYPELDGVGLADGGKDINVIVFGKDKRRYPWSETVLDEDFSEESFREFMRLVVLKKVPAYDPGADSHVQTLTSTKEKDWDSIVGDVNKDVLINFYSPECGHCRAFAPVYARLARRLASRYPDVLFARFDAQALRPPLNFSVSAYPTLYLARRGRKMTPLRHDGALTADAIDAFLADVLTKQQPTAAAAKDEL